LTRRAAPCRCLGGLRELVPSRNDQESTKRPPLLPQYSVHHSVPSGPVVMLWSPPPSEGTVNSVTNPVVVPRCDEMQNAVAPDREFGDAPSRRDSPILPPDSVNQSAPSARHRCGQRFACAETKPAQPRGLCRCFCLECLRRLLSRRGQSPAAARALRRANDIPRCSCPRAARSCSDDIAPVRDCLVRLATARSIAMS
jgi:hypothetical protein